MLQTIRDRASGWIAYIIIILISIPFALWGIQEYLGGSDPRLVAEVNGQEIPIHVFNREMQQQKRYLQAIMGGQLPPGYNDLILRQNALNRVVRSELLRQELENAGYHVGDNQLFKRINSIPEFSSGGAFNKQRYEQILNSQGRTVVDFEQDLRRQIRIEQFVDGISQSEFLSASSKKDYLRLKYQQREIQYFVINTDPEKARTEISDEEILSYFDTHKDRFQTPERVRLAYLELEEKALIENMEVDEDALRVSYEEQSDQYVNPEQRRARHILLRISSSDAGDVSEKEIEQIKQRADDLVVRLRQGEDFSTLAKQYSEDTLSASSGGDLGFITRGDMDPEFEEVLFDLDINQISDPVKTERGFQVIQLLDIVPEAQKSFDEVRDQIALDYKQRNAESRYLEMVEQLLTLSYEQPDSLTAAAEALALDVKTTSWVTEKHGDGLAANPKIRQVAFSEEVLKQGRNSDLVELADGHVVVLRIEQHEDAKPKSLEEVNEQIRDAIANDKARGRAASQGKQAIDDLRSGTDIATAVEKFNVQLQEPGLIGRDDKQISESIVNKAFVIKKPKEGAISVGGIQLSNGDYAVIVLRSVKENPQIEEDKEALVKQQAVEYGSRELEAVFKTLETGADILIMRENLEDR